MILRKPYAFLIKNFQKINIVLLLLAIFLFVRNLDLYNFVKEYLDYKTYNPYISPISKYIDILSYIGVLVLLVITSILIYLLKYKDKPILSYLLIFISYLYMLIIFIVDTSFFNNLAGKSFDLPGTLMIKDLTFIASLPQYVVFVLLFIRSIGLDLKKFGFNEDKEFIKTTEEDNEEVEVAVGIDYDKLKRRIREKFRYIKYFFLEHKFSLSLIFLIGIGIFSYGIYNYIYVVNKVYDMGESFISNNYRFSVNATYLTDKDYAGNVITKDKYYIVLDVSVDNLLNKDRLLDIEKFFLYTNTQYYIPATRYNTNFVDMGNLYKKEKLKAKRSTNYLLIFEVDKPEEDENFILAYQDVSNKNLPLKKVKIKVTDLSKFKEKSRKGMLEDLKVPLNKDEAKEMIVYNYSIVDSVLYTYKDCNVYDCYMVEDIMRAQNNKKILYMKMNFFGDSNMEFINFATRYGKVKYKINGVWYTSKMVDASPRYYNGSHLYILVEDELVNAEEIQLVFTIRTYQYFYVLKG